MSGYVWRMKYGLSALDFPVDHAREVQWVFVFQFGWER
jgi:hypothetical protein